MAYSDVNSFLGVFDGGARPNRYNVNITSARTAGAGTIDTSIQFLCRATSIPGSILGAAEVAYMGRAIKVAGDRTFDDWTVTIYNNTDFRLRIFFEAWSNGMLKNFANVTDFQSDESYLADGYVEQLDRNEQVMNRYDFRKIFPLSVGDIALAYDSNNTVEEFSVTFAVNYWTASNSTDQG
jgi:hypothetical protein